MDKIKPCPFCGGEGEVHIINFVDMGIAIRCKECLARGPFCSSVTYAIYRWNRRYELPCPTGPVVPAGNARLKKVE